MQLDSVGPFYKRNKHNLHRFQLQWNETKLLFQKRTFTKATAKSSHSVDLYDNSKIIQQLNYTFIPMKDYLATVSQAYPMAQ